MATTGMAVRHARAVAPAGSWPADRAVDTLTLAFDDRHRRRLRLAADGGTDVLLDLPDAVVLNDGDGLVLEGGGWVAVRAAPEDLLEVTAASPAALVRLAWHIGNRHVPADLGADRILIRDDHVLADMLRGLGAVVRPVCAPFRPETGAYGHRHDNTGTT